MFLSFLAQYELKYAQVMIHIDYRYCWQHALSFPPNVPITVLISDLKENMYTIWNMQIFNICNHFLMSNSLHYRPKRPSNNFALKFWDYGLQLKWRTGDRERERGREGGGGGGNKKIRSFTATLADRLLPLGTSRGLAEKSHGVWQCAEEQVWKLLRPTASSAITSF